ncbi:hypothetical protein K458DRAFT_355509 [Lentithecium fluviatile CBS 122367]|uniref:Lytic polysaccharide monooxygenase n=1 Tax=Lentithecium fluviatile CBS 122367 TaxID=1168545 RepID=A0A6G1JKH6_9PLEO|nr:hypothetical protein K458DRAFT_355509 [Lentithecium fluviatile CBS 122367]
MPFSRALGLSAFAALLSSAVSTGTTNPHNPDSICYSYGVDFVDEGHYFINTLSSENFTSVSTFEGCNEDTSEVLFVDPAGDEYLCSQIPTLPDDTPQLSTCPILKSQMAPGDYILLLIGNNDNGQPFAWQRDLYLDCGPQVTSTYTPTITFNITTTPTVTATQTSTQTITSTITNSLTYTVPSKTAKKIKTVTPSPVFATSTKTFTRVKTTWTKDLRIITKTATATCTTSTPSKPDKPCTYSPTLLHPEALVTPTAAAKFHRFMKKADRAVDIKYARARIEAAKLKRDQKARDAAAPLEKRAPDAPTLTVTASTPVNFTSTYTAAAVTNTESTVVSTTTTFTQPPVTIYSGIFTSTVTAPTPTKTRFSFAYTTSLTTKTIHATWTRTTTITPSASVTACKKRGGHWGSARW